jgi:hypothetical protein
VFVTLLVLKMVTLVVAQHRNQSQEHARSSKQFRGINCRTFQTGYGILPTPFKSTTSPSPDTKSKTPLTTPVSKHDNKRQSKVEPNSAPVAIKDKGYRKERTFVDPNGSFSLSELWAGPTYSNSPPPSSLPIPKFSVRPKRTVSLELPVSDLPEIEMRKIANSAPCSPRGEDSPFARDFLVKDDSATKTLCRILNLNLDYE